MQDGKGGAKSNSIVVDTKSADNINVTMIYADADNEWNCS